MCIVVYLNVKFNWLGYMVQSQLISLLSLY